MQPKWFLLGFTISVLVALACVGGFNFIVDPEKIYSSGDVEDEMVEILLSGKSAQLNGRYDYGVLYKKLITKLEKNFDVISCGSSQAAQIDSRSFPGQRFFNHHPDAGGFADCLGILNIYERHNKMPKKVVLEISYIRGNYLWRPTWRTLNLDYLKMKIKLSMRVRPGEFFNLGGEKVNLFYSRQYLELAWKYYSKNGLADSFKKTEEVVKKIEREVVEPDKTDSTVVRFDGSLPRVLKKRDLKEIAKGSLTQAYKCLERTENDLKEEYFTALERITKRLRENGVEVFYFFSPLHEVTYEECKKTTYLQAYTKRVKNIASRFKVNLVGGFAPDVHKCPPELFSDGALHTFSKCSLSIFKRYRESKLGGN